MGWLGKVIGGTIGFAIGGPIGAIAGAVFGHGFDISEQRLLSGDTSRLSGNEEVQMTFFVAVFSMLAKLAKADGRICENEIESIQNFMNNDLRLDPESKKVAIDIFRAASESSSTFESFARQFYLQFQSQPGFLEIVLDVMLRVAIADGTLCHNEEAMILSAASIFNIRHDAYLKFKSKYVDMNQKYYSILGCDSTDPDQQIKKQYRKLVNEYHPDKIASKGLPEEFSKFAADRFREIQEAYEAVKKERGMK